MTNSPDERGLELRELFFETSQELLQALNDEALKLEKKPGVNSVAPFGMSLHVSGRDRAALEAAIALYRNDPKLVWKEIEASLEDVFIGLMAQAKDNVS